MKGKWALIDGNFPENSGGGKLKNEKFAQRGLALNGSVP